MAKVKAQISFDEPFDEAVEAFLGKEIMSRPEFDALAKEMRGDAFTAAYVYAADDLQEVYDAVLAALENKSTLADFTAQVGDILTRDWHRETVFRTNMLSAYGKGHWDQAQVTKEMRPYARYTAVMDGRTRPTHAELHGMVYPLDHPFWQEYWPPWDYNCRCAAVTLSPEEVQQEGLEVRSGWEGVPPPNPAFSSPAAGEQFSPNYEKYPPHLAQAVKRKATELHDGAGSQQ